MQRIAPKDLARLVGAAIAAPGRIGLDVTDDRYRMFLTEVAAAATRVVDGGAVVNVIAMDATNARAWHVVIDEDVAAEPFAAVRWATLVPDDERYDALRTHLNSVLLDEILDA